MTVIGYCIKPQNEQTLVALRAIDPQAGEAGVWVRGTEMNAWFKWLEQEGGDLDFSVESKEMDELAFYGLEVATLESFGIVLSS